MEILTLYFIALIGTVLWFINAETASVYYGSQLGWNPAFVGLVCALGQCTTFALLYLGGARLLGRWKKLGGKVERLRERYGEHLENRFLLLTAISGVVGLPPLVALSSIAAGFRVPPSHLLVVAALFRWIRFTTLASVGPQIFAWF